MKIISHNMAETLFHSAVAVPLAVFAGLLFIELSLTASSIAVYDKRLVLLISSAEEKDSVCFHRTTVIALVPSLFDAFALSQIPTHGSRTKNTDWLYLRQSRGNYFPCGLRKSSFL